MLKQHASTVTRLQKDVERAKQEIKNLEADLSTTGSTKTADDVQTELDALTNEL